MKTKSILFAAILSLQVSFLFATGTDTRLRSASYEFATVSLTDLAPVTPAEATFEDAAIARENMDVFGLIPVTPVVATFDDETVFPLAFSNLAPVTPVEADFNDDGPGQVVDIARLAPATPVSADFEELK